MRVAIALLAASLAAAGTAVALAHRVGPTPDPGRRCAAGALQPLGSPGVSYAAVVKSRASVYRSPGYHSFASFGRLNYNQVPTVFGVRARIVRRDCAASWFLVQVPLRPNGVTGFVSAREVILAHVFTRIEIAVSERRLTFFRRGRRLLSTRVAVGSSATPTPIGHFYVNQRLIPTDPSGPYGPAALGVSAFSNVLTGWTQGGPIGIHGTNEPWSIGRASSNGCIRVPNSTLRRLFRWTSAGTPVIIHP